MRPLSPLYYIFENKRKTFCLIFLMFLEFPVYLGGLYVTNPDDNFLYEKKNFSEKYIEVVFVNPQDEITLEENRQRYLIFRNMLQNDEKLNFTDVKINEYVDWNTIMSFTESTALMVFPSVEDFERHCANMGIKCDTSEIKELSLILTRRFADNIGAAPGDSDIFPDLAENYSLDAVTDEEGYLAYAIGTERLSNRVLVYTNKTNRRMIMEKIQKCIQESGVQVIVNSVSDNDAADESFKMVFTFLLISVSVILAVTINAVFIGVYQRRNFEFAVYRAVGLKKSTIVIKIISEIVCMQIMALVFGGMLFFTALYLFNNLVLYPKGLYLRYFDPVALKSIAAVIVLIYVPLIISRVWQVKKAEVMDY